MPKSDTRSAALSRLFGSKPDARERERRVTDRQDEEQPRGAEADLARPVEKREPTQAGTPSRTQASDDVARSDVEEKPGVESDEPRRGPETSDDTKEGEGSGYIGSGRYRRRTGVLERITPYVRPDQAEALRVAVALRNDPRGTDISSIIQSLLDEAGYCDRE